MEDFFLKLHGSIWGSLLRVFVSGILGSTFYLIWMGMFLWIRPQGGFTQTVMWVVAPLFTGVGFGVGVYLTNQVIRERQDHFLRITVWPLIGCSVGALLVYWFGPMLIVFSMLAAGAFSIAVREFFCRRE